MPRKAKDYRGHLQLRSGKMADPKKEQGGEVPDLPPVDPADLEEAARRFISAKKPPGGWNGGGWNGGQKGQGSEPPKPSNG